MKNLIMLLLLSGSVNAYSQTSVDSIRKELLIAKQMADPKSKSYKPDRAFAIYNKLSDQDNPEAMNGLGILYSKGIGTSENIPEAINLFKKSAKLGYARSYYNMGLLYKDGAGVEQDFVKSFNYFKAGSKLNDKTCIYSEGYMRYKGLGCNQDYGEAAKLFKRGVALRSVGSIYMLGLCYRNGYGVAVNLDSARHMLSLAAKWGDERAIQELSSTSPENLNIQSVPDLQPRTSTMGKPVDLKKGFKKVSHYLPPNDISGEYSGFSIKYDWSGKHIIGQSSLNLSLSYKEKTLTGQWVENEDTQVDLRGIVTDSAVVFSNAEYLQTDHYNKNNPLLVTFKNSRLQLIKSKDTVYLTGNMSLYSPQSKEPEKPEFIMLIRTGAKIDSVLNQNDEEAKVDSIHFIAYPNPFSGPLKLRYTLKKTVNVNIIVSDLLNANIVYKSKPILLKEGEYTDVIEFNGHPGNYVVTLQYGGKIKSAIVFKQ